MIDATEETLLLAKIKEKNNFPIQRWIALKKYILQMTHEINIDTTWTESEPEWWLEMMEIQKKLITIRGQ